VTNRTEVLCLDLDGLADGNDGPFTDEAAFMTPRGSARVKVTATDADIIWRFDLVEQGGVHPHDSPHASILIDGQFLYLNSGNGVDNTHRKIRKPDAPSLVVLDKATGRLVGRDRERIGPMIIHSTWSSPAMGTVGGRRLVFYGGGDGVCYAFEPLAAMPPEGKVATLKKVWSFDCDPTAPKKDIHKYMGNRTESPSLIKGMPVFHDGRVYVSVTGDIWWGKRKASLMCIDASGSGDVTASGLLWSYPLARHGCSTPAIHDALVYITDCGGGLHCVDAKTGKAVWTHDTQGEIWASPLVADGKVYVGTRKRHVWVFAAGRAKKVLARISMDGAIHGSLTAANGTLYLATMARLYAIAKAQPK
jgi:outer membrane protein assembly factor BamB